MATIKQIASGAANTAGMYAANPALAFTQFDPSNVVDGVKGIARGAQNLTSGIKDSITNRNDGAVNISSGSGSGGGSDAAYYNQLISQYQNSLNNISNSLDELNKGSQNQRDTNLNELQSSFNKNKRSYDTNSQQNLQNNQLTKNKIADQASQGLRGLLRTLGANGAGGSSAAAYLAPNAVTDTANAELADANSTFAQNQQNLDTNWNDYLNDYDNDKKKIEDAYQSSLRSNEQNVLNQRNNILNQLISAYAGAGRSGDMANATRQINENTNRINELNRFAKPTYNGTTATYTPADLASYNTGNTNVRTSLSGATNATNNPTLAMLLGVGRRKSE